MLNKIEMVDGLNKVKNVDGLQKIENADGLDKIENADWLSLRRRKEKRRVQNFPRGKKLIWIRLGGWLCVPAVLVNGDTLLKSGDRSKGKAQSHTR